MSLSLRLTGCASEESSSFFLFLCHFFRNQRVVRWTHLAVAVWSSSSRKRYLQAADGERKNQCPRHLHKYLRFAFSVLSYSLPLQISRHIKNSRCCCWDPGCSQATVAFDAPSVRSMEHRGLSLLLCMKGPPLWTLTPFYPAPYGLLRAPCVASPVPP